MFGPRDTDFLDYFKWIKRGILPSLASKPRQFSLCYVKDLSEALYLCSQKELESGEIFNIANPAACYWDELGKTAGQEMGKKLKTVKVPLAFLYLAALLSGIGGKIRRSPNIFDINKFKDMTQTGWVADTRKAREKLSFRTHYTLPQAVKETIDWYRENNWL